MSKTKKRKFIEKTLRFMARRILIKHKPKVVAVTGSGGKATTRDMIAKVLADNHTVRRNSKNFNEEVGVPMTIIGVEPNEDRSISVSKVFLEWILALFSNNYPEILVLEMGADRPGDIKRFCDYIPVDVGVVTNVGISHLEFFKTQENIAKEKGRVLKVVPNNGLAITNYDSEYARGILDQVKANSLTYGFNEKANLRASDVDFNYEMENVAGQNVNLPKGVSFKLNYKGSIVPIKLKHCLSESQVYSALAALAVGEYFKLNLMEMISSLEDFFPPSGRSVAMPGIKHTSIIDDTYNSSSPEGTLIALEVLKKIEAKRKIVVLGDMLEMGPEEESGHELIGREISKMNPDHFVTVGKRMRLAAKEYEKIKDKKTVAVFDSPDKAKFFVQDLIKPGDLILIKGSQGMRMEKVVEEIVDNPVENKSRLVRQDSWWLNQPFGAP